MLRVLSAVWKVWPQTICRSASERLAEEFGKAGDEIRLSVKIA